MLRSFPFQEGLISVQAMSWVIDQSEHKLGSLIVLLIIANHAKSDGTGAWPSIATIAREARLSESQTHRCIRTLQRSGELLVEVACGPRGTNLYHLPKMRQRNLEEGRNLEGVAKATKNKTKMAPEPSLNHQTTKTPLPPANAGEWHYFDYQGETIAFQMGRHSRPPSLKGTAGAHATDIVEHLNRHRYPARVA